jgi:NAD(P)-dependent dehydrogenase (short-subunit alcohol dehydrogenase family)
MRARGSGSIVNIASTSGLVAATSGMDYSVSKAALRHLTRWAAMELGECGVRVNSISPGFIVTGIFGKGAGLSDSDAKSQLASLAQEAPAELAKIQPISRPGTGADVAAAALWLAGDASGYVTGHDLVVDGGQTVGQPYSVMQQQRTKLAEILEATPTRRAP